jgi:streptomycin 6-kinase
MEKIQSHLNTIEQWKTELVQVSKQDIVNELYRRCTPIFQTLLKTIQQQEQRISILEEKLNKN